MYTNLIYLFVILFLTIKSEASVIGLGELTTGLSFYEDEQDLGLGLNYQLNFNTARQNTKMLTNLNLTTGDVTLPNGHSKIFTDNQALIEVDNRAELRKKSIYWQTNAVYKTTKNNVSGVRNEDWQYLIGPTLERKIRSDILMTADYKWSKSKLNETTSDNDELILKLNKLFSSTNNLSLVGQHTCWEYDDRLLKDDCIDSFRIDYAINGSTNNFSFGYGLAKIENTKEAIYSASYKHLFRGFGEFALKYGREASNLRSRAELISDTDEIPTASINETMAAIYVKRFKRLTVQTSSELIVNNSELDETKENENLLDINYNIGSILCPTCSIGFLYREGEAGLGNYKEQLISINYPIRKEILSVFSLRQTEDDVIGRYISMNISFILNKKDQISSHQ